MSVIHIHYKKVIVNRTTLLLNVAKIGVATFYLLPFEPSALYFSVSFSFLFFMSISMSYYSSFSHRILTSEALLSKKLNIQRKMLPQ